MKDIPEINLSRMTETPMCAVICRDTDELKIFFSNAQRQLGKYLRWDYNDIRNIWENYGGSTGFTLFVSRDSVSDSMSYCYEDWFARNGYENIELSDLCAIKDIEESDKPITFLTNMLPGVSKV